jgi:hypothetical protein
VIDPRLLSNQIEAVSNHLGKAVAHAMYEPDMASHYVTKAKRIIEEIEREIFWASRRSGEVK